MGRGEGWFHRGKARHNWKWLAARYDTNHDGKITRQEFTRHPALFEKLDRNHDGEMTPEDFDWSDRSPFIRQGGLPSQWMPRLHPECKGPLPPPEREAFFSK